MGYNSVADSSTVRVCLHSFSRCWLPNLQKRRNSERIWPWSRSSRSSIVVSIESAYTTSYWSLIVTLVVSHTVFEILAFKARKWLPHPSLFWRRPFRENPLEFLDEIYPTKTRRMGLPFGENFMILTSTVFDWSTRLTNGDGRAIAYSALSYSYVFNH